MPHLYASDPGSSSMRRPMTLPITVCERCRTNEIACREKHSKQGLQCCPSCDHEPQEMP